jgi:ABC-type Mn2+/Zn2+ transport system ATPase subunit
MKNVNIDIPKGKFTMVLGDIGSGKSSLLYSILAEMKPEPGHSPQVNINGSIALVVQKAWIMSCSVEDNILMTLPRE